MFETLGRGGEGGVGVTYLHYSDKSITSISLNKTSKRLQNLSKFNIFCKNIHKSMKNK